jgi:hypothetical protein
MATDLATEAFLSLDTTVADSRRLDIDGKQHLVARFLHDCECEGVLVLHPANFRWLTAGANPVGLYGRDEWPGLYFNSQQRWLLASATDSPRLFAEELDGLGFMLKEWHWSASREQMLADLVYGRKVACDQPFRECKYTGAFFANERRKLSTHESGRLAELGKTVAHAVEATARNFDWGESEQEIAGQVAHRLVRHGAEPVEIQVHGDGRARQFRRRGIGSSPVESSCIVQATGRQFGLHASAARTVFRARPADNDKAEFDAAMRWRVAHLATAHIGDRVAVSLEAGKVALRPTAFEHEWRAAPPVALTGREPSEGIFLPTAQDRWTAGWAVVWQERIAGAAIVDTYFIGPDGWQSFTPPSEWPIRRAKVAERTFDIADLLVRGT